MQELYPVKNKVINLPKARSGLKRSISQTFKTEDEHFQVPLFKNLVQQLKDFCQTEHRIALLLGPKGCGKTKLLKLFQACHANCHILNHSNGKLFHPNDVAENSDVTKNAFEQLVQQFDQSIEGVVLLIDNADLLTVDQFNLIMKFCATDENSAVKIILAGDDSLSRRVVSLFENDFPLIPYTAIPIAPLSFTEMKFFLRQTFGSSKTDKKLLSSKNLEKIFQLSKGYPGRVNNVATQLLAELSGRSIRPQIKKKKVWYIDMFILSSILLLLLGITLQVIQQANLFRSVGTPPARPMLVTKQHIILPPPNDAAVPIDELASPSYIASIEGLPEQVPPDAIIDLPEPQLVKN